MPLEAKELLEYLGTKAENIEEFKAAFDKDFIKQSMITEESEPVKKIVGKLYGTLENEVKKIAKEVDLDVDFESDEFKGLKKVSDKFKFIASKIDFKYKDTISDLTTKASQGNDEKVKEWESKYEKAAIKLKEKETLLGSVKGEFDIYKENTQKSIKDTALNIHKKEIFGKAKFAEGTKDLEKKGFWTTIAEKYKFDLDETENPIILNGKGEKIVSKKTAGTFMTPEEVIEEELVSANLFQLNKDGGKHKPKEVIYNQQNNQQNNQSSRSRGRVIADPLE